MEALANVNEFGFCELQDDELMEVDGGGYLADTWDDVKDVAKAAAEGVVGASNPIEAAVGALAGAAIETYHEVREDFGYEPQD